jgi:hypothetical protein
MIRPMLSSCSTIRSFVYSQIEINQLRRFYFGPEALGLYAHGTKIGHFTAGRSLASFPDALVSASSGDRSMLPTEAVFCGKSPGNRLSPA